MTLPIHYQEATTSPAEEVVRGPPNYRRHHVVSVIDIIGVQRKVVTEKSKTLYNIRVHPGTHNHRETPRKGIIVIKLGTCKLLGRKNFQTRYSGRLPSIHNVNILFMLACNKI